jgi:hypothetical protein
VKIGFVGLLQIAFIILKICNIIKWSWFLVFIPFYFGFFIWIFALGIMVIIALLDS